MSRIVFFFFLIVVGYACGTKPVDLGLATPYFPSAIQLRDGIVSKYYIHRIPNNKDSNTSTDIEYRKLQYLDPGILEWSTYDAAFDLVNYKKIDVNGNQFFINNEFWILRGDTVFRPLIKNMQIDWNENNTTPELVYKPLAKYNRQYKRQLIAIRDTTMIDRNCKLIESKERIIHLADEQKSMAYDKVEIYCEALGLVATKNVYEEFITHGELVEQMSIHEFEKRKGHNRKRIAYIDPKKAMDQNSDFKLCYKEEKIGDYYNDFRGELRGGKGTWWRILEDRLDTSLLKKESGFLTVRFIINCEGAVGRFIVEGADLDYNDKQFSQELIDHFYSIVSSQTDWQICKNRKEAIDVYAYITFKLKDGKIIELLP